MTSMAKPPPGGGRATKKVTLPMAHVQVLIGTRNGARYLGAQLASLLGQGHDDWSLLVADDGSGGGTREILETFRAANPQRRIEIGAGPQRGSAANYLSLLARTRPGDFVAFADQDDVWMPDRLHRALEGLGRARSGGGAGRVYASRTILTDSVLQPIRESRLHGRRLSFANALVQNVLAGNTILLDPVAAATLRQRCHRPSPPGCDITTGGSIWSPRASGWGLRTTPPPPSTTGNTGPTCWVPTKDSGAG